MRVLLLLLQCHVPAEVLAGLLVGSGTPCAGAAGREEPEHAARYGGPRPSALRLRPHVTGLGAVLEEQSNGPAGDTCEGLPARGFWLAPVSPVLLRPALPWTTWSRH